jgi:hypothetical protein
MIEQRKFIGHGEGDIAVSPEKGVPSSAKRKIFPPSIVG